MRHRSGALLIAVLSTTVLACLSLCSPAARADDDLQQINMSGFGQGPAVAQATASTSFNNILYVGTRRPAGGCQVWSYSQGTWSLVADGGFGDAANVAVTSMATRSGELFAGTENSATGGEVWGYDGSQWTQRNADGFGNPHNTRVSCMGVYQDLYAGTENAAEGCQAWKLSSGAWTRLGHGGLGNPSNTCASSIFVIGGNYFLLGTENVTDGCEVLEYDYHSWEHRWVQGGFGDPNNTRVSAIIRNTKDNKYYFSTRNEVTGTELWRWTFGATDWTQVNQDGFGSPANTDCPCLIAPGSGFLTAATANAVGFQMWWLDGTQWVRSSSDGAADPCNTEAMSLLEFSGRRYLATENASSGCQVLEETRPRIVSVQPSKGTRGETMDVTITGEGTHFVDGLSRAWFYGATMVTVNSTTVLDPTHAVANITLGGQVGTGASLDVNVLTGAEAPTRLEYGFQYRAPYISYVTPDSGARGQTLDVTISGTSTSFVQGTSVAVFSGEGITVNSTTVIGQSTAVANVTLSQDIEHVARDVNVVTGTEVPEPRAGGFRVRYPTITRVEPAIGKQGETLYVDIWGSECEFMQGRSMPAFSGEGITLEAASFLDINHVRGRITIAEDAQAVRRDVTVVTGSEVATPLSEGFEVQHVSHIASVTPDSAAIGQTLDVQIVGDDTWFEEGASTAVFGSEGITVNSTRVIDPTHAVANITVGQGVEAGWSSVCVQTEGDTCVALDNGLYVRHPAIESITPTSAGQGRTLEITVNGNSTLFVEGLSRAVFDPPEGITVNRTSVVFGGKAVVEVTVAQGASLGKRSINVITGDEVPAPLADCFTVRNPRIVSITPTQVNQGGHYRISINAVDMEFPAGRCTPYFSGKGIKVMAIAVTPQTVIADVEIASNAPHGPRDVGVLVEDGDQPDPLPGALLVRYCDSRVISVSPSSGKQNTNVDVMVTATSSRFKAGESEVYVAGFGVLVTRSTVIDATHIKARLSVQATAEMGSRDISVEGPSGARQLRGAFNVTSGKPHVSRVSPASGAPGDVIVVTGDGFGEPQESSRVDFGEEHSPRYVEWTYTRIKCIVPPGATSGQVRVKSICGTSNPKNFTVTNTRKGSDVTVIPQEGVRVTYEQVTASGQTDCEASSDPRLEGYRVSSGSCRDISSSVTFLGKAMVTLPLPESGFTAEERQRIVVLHEENGRWVDRTLERDLRSDTITAEVSSFSRFAVAYPFFASTWYLAEGSTDWGFECYISIENPNARAATAQVTFMTGKGPVGIKDIKLPARSQVRINPRQYLGATDFSTKVVCKENLPIAVDRTMSWTVGSSGTGEAHSSVGVNFPEKVWYLAEGSSDWGFECWLLIQNPNKTTARCQVTYMTEGAGSRIVEKVIPPNCRRTYNMTLDIGPRDASIKVTSDVGVIAERAMYRNGRREGHGSIGVNAPATDFYLPEGATAWGFTTYVLVQNPGSSPADVEVTYMTPSGAVPQPAFRMEPYSRKTIRVNEVLPDKDVSTRVHADVPIIAERAMYWGAGTPAGEACHDSVGMPDPHTAFYLPDGQTGGGCETWTLVQNPNPVPVTIEIQYLTGSSKGPVTQAVDMEANSRRTFNMADVFAGRAQASIVVRSLTPRKKIMCERAMYWNQRTMGTDTIGGCSD